MSGLDESSQSPITLLHTRRDPLSCQNFSSRPNLGLPSALRVDLSGPGGTFRCSAGETRSGVRSVRSENAGRAIRPDSLAVRVDEMALEERAVQETVH